MEQFDPTASYQTRRDFYRQLTKDPDYRTLSPEDRLDVARKVLFPSERPAIQSPSEDEPTPLGRKVAAGAERVLTGIAKAAPFPGAIRALTAPETVPKEQRNLPYLVNPIPEVVSETFQRGVEGVRNVFGHNAAKLVEDIGGAMPFLPLAEIGPLARNLRLYRSYEPDISTLRDVTPHAPESLPSPSEPTPATQLSLPSSAARLQLISPARGSAEAFEQDLSAEEALRQSPAGRIGLLKQLQATSGPPEGAIPMRPQGTSAVPETVKPKRASPVQWVGWQETPDLEPEPLWNLTRKIKDYPKGSTVGPDTLRKIGIEPPEPPTLMPVRETATSRTAEDFEINPTKMADLKKGYVAFKQGNRIISAKVGEIVNGREVYNHADLALAKGLDFDKAVPGFLDKAGKFIEQYPQETETAIKAPETMISPERPVEGAQTPETTPAGQGVRGAGIQKPIPDISLQKTAIPDPIQGRLEALGIEVPRAETQPPEIQAPAVQTAKAPETYQELPISQEGAKEPTVTLKRGPGIEEPTQAKSPEPEGGKQPWQMTRAEFYSKGNVETFTPKGTVLKVGLINKNVKAHGMGSGTAYLTKDGFVSLDGEIYRVGDSAYLFKEKFYRKPPKELIQEIEEGTKPHVDMLIQESEKIDRNAIAPIREFPAETGPFAGETYKDTSIRYRSLSGQDYNRRAYGEKIDAISKTHDPQAIRNAIVNEELEKHRFQIGGYLHVTDKSQLTPTQKAAIESYHNQGGSLGRTAIEALEGEQAAQIASAYHGGDVRASEHKQAIIDAIARGKSVPEKVLADYPELIKSRPSLSTPSSGIRPRKFERPIWADEFESVGGKINPDGTVDLYHATTKEKAQQILKEGTLRRPTETPDSYGVYLSSSPEVARDYGDGTLIKVRVPVEDIKPDDVFPGQRMDFSTPTKKGIYKPVSVESPERISPPSGGGEVPSSPVPNISFTKEAGSKNVAAQPTIGRQERMAQLEASVREGEQRLKSRVNAIGEKLSAAELKATAKATTNARRELSKLQRGGY